MSDYQPNYAAQYSSGTLKDMVRDSQYKQQQSREMVTGGIGVGRNLYSMWKSDQNLALETMMNKTVDFVDPETGVEKSLSAFKMKDDLGLGGKFFTPATGRVSLDKDAILDAIGKEKNTYLKADLKGNTSEVNRFIKEHLDDVTDDSTRATIEAAMDREEDTRSLIDKLGDSKFGKALNTLNTLSSIKGIADDYSSGNVSGTTHLKTANVAAKALATNTAKNVMAKFLGAEAAKWVSSTAGGPVGTTLAILSTLADLGKMIPSEAQRKKQEMAYREGIRSNPLYASRWAMRTDRNRWLTS